MFTNYLNSINLDYSAIESIAVMVLGTLVASFTIMAGLRIFKKMAGEDYFDDGFYESEGDLPSEVYDLAREFDDDIAREAGWFFEDVEADETVESGSNGGGWYESGDDGVVREYDENGEFVKYVEEDNPHSGGWFEYDEDGSKREYDENGDFIGYVDEIKTIADVEDYDLGDVYGCDYKDEDQEFDDEAPF